MGNSQKEEYMALYSLKIDRLYKKFVCFQWFKPIYTAYTAFSIRPIGFLHIYKGQVVIPTSVGKKV